jgi:exopolysaccharide biosynthesis WecB/TagA/CpsF family protein
MFHLRIRDASVAVNISDRAALLDEVRERLSRGAGFAIATVNLDHLVKLGRTAAFRQAYARQDLVTADGHPVVWLSRLSGQPVSLVTGSDLVDPLVELAGRDGVPIALLGATRETLARAAAALTARHPGLAVVACLAPGNGFDAHGAEADALIEALRGSGARLTFLALGAPRQEMFAARCRDALPAMGLVSVGAGLDFIARSQRRAPAWMRRLALEWLWRLLSDPRRLGVRYLRCAAALPRVTLDTVLAGRFAARSVEAAAPLVVGRELSESS